MQIFSRDNDLAVRSYLLKILNHNCSGLRALIEGPRGEDRVNLTLVVMVVPIEKNHLVTKQAFTAVTKEFSSNGVGIVLDSPRGLDEAFLGLRHEQEVIWFFAKAEHLSPMGGGFFQLGFRLTGKIHPSDYPELQTLHF